jgi:pimeloyl-ACP methyl ester carboxylesterase
MVKTLMKTVFIAIALVVLAFLAWFIPAKLGWLASDRAKMIERYAQPPSQMLNIDGVPMHVRVEGEGFPVLMLHGTGVNLHEWDPLAERLKNEYKVVRLDWPPYGLSGPNDRGYTTPEAARLVGLTLDELGIDKAVMIATSNGNNVGLELNKDRPDLFLAMALSILPLERPSQTRKVDWRILKTLKFHKAVMPNYRSKYFFRLVLEDTSAPGWAAPDYMVQLMYDMVNLPGAIDRQGEYIAANVTLFQTTDVGAIAEYVDVPVLLQWCWQDTVISQGAESSVARFTATDVTVIDYKNVGHWPMWEIPDQFADDIRTFLEETLPAT